MTEFEKQYYEVKGINWYKTNANCDCVNWFPKEKETFQKQME